MLTSTDLVGCFSSSVGFQSAEYTVLLEFYSKLLDILQVKALAPYLAEGHVLSPPDKEHIDTISSQKKAADFLLAKILALLKSGFVNHSVSFYKLLDIAKKHGNNETAQLCSEIEVQIIMIRSGNQGNRRYVC